MESGMLISAVYLKQYSVTNCEKHRQIELHHILLKYVVLLPLAINVLDEGVRDSVPDSLPASGWAEHWVRP